MPDPEGRAELLPIPGRPPGPQVINDQSLLRTENGRRLVIVSGIVLAQYAVDDRIAEAHARLSLVELGLVDQNGVAAAFACSARTVRRDQRRFDDGGMGAQGQASGYPQGRPRLTLPRRVERLTRDGHSNCEIARRPGRPHPHTVRRGGHGRSGSDRSPTPRLFAYAQLPSSNASHRRPMR